MKKFILPVLLVLASFSAMAQKDTLITLKLSTAQVNLILISLGELKLSEGLQTYVYVRQAALNQINRRKPDSVEVKKVPTTAKPK